MLDLFGGEVQQEEAAVKPPPAPPKRGQPEPLVLCVSRPDPARITGPECWSGRTLDEYAGVLSGERASPQLEAKRAAIEAHVRVCVRCAALVAKFREEG